MRKSLALIFTLTLIAAVVLLAFYSTGRLDGDGVRFVDGIEYESGGFTYHGGLKEGHFEGAGVISFDGGARYNGHFINGRFEGSGVYYDGWRFDGELANGKITGGTFQNENGETVVYDPSSGEIMFAGRDWNYDGGFNERGQNGEGTFRFQDGSVYVGDFYNGLAEGEGIYLDALGNLIYSGGFVNGLFDGQGEYHSPEGWSYSGGFAYGLFNGEGVYKNGSEMIKGFWENGVQTINYE